MATEREKYGFCRDLDSEIWFEQDKKWDLGDGNIENQGLAMWLGRHKIVVSRTKDVVSAGSDIRFGRGLFQSPPKWK